MGNQQVSKSILQYFRYKWRLAYTFFTKPHLDVSAATTVKFSSADKKPITIEANVLAPECSVIVLISPGFSRNN